MSKKIKEIKFGVPYFDVFDPRFKDFSVPIAVRGTLSIKLAHYNKYIKKYCNNNAKKEDLTLKIRNIVTQSIKETVTNIPMQYSIPVLQIERKIDFIITAIKAELAKKIKKYFGVALYDIYIQTIDINKHSDGYQQLKAITQDIALENAQSEAELQIEKQRIELEYYAEILKNQANSPNPIKSSNKKGFWIFLFGILSIGLLLTFLYFYR